MAHADDATKAWVSAIPKKNADGNVVRMVEVKYKYTKGDHSHTFQKEVKIDTPSKAPGSILKLRYWLYADRPLG
jgi:hypothetical protein